MHSPKILATPTGEILIDFRPIIGHSMKKISLRGTRGGEDLVIQRTEYQVVASYDLFGVPRKTRQGRHWEIEYKEWTLFWEVFDSDWQGTSEYMTISPGLDVFLFCFFLGKVQGCTKWADTSNMGQETLAKFQLLRSGGDSEQLRTLTQKLGAHLSVHRMLDNFIEGEIMGLEVGRRPPVKLPYPKLTKDDVMEIARGTKQSLGLGLGEGGELRRVEKETKAAIAYIDGLERREFHPRRALAKLIRLCWGLWPPWSSVHDGVDHWFIKKVYQGLEAAVSP